MVTIAFSAHHRRAAVAVPGACRLGANTPLRTLPFGTGIRRRAVYDAYVASHAWRQRRRAWYAAWLATRGVRNGHLNHLTYMRIGDEDAHDLVPLCAKDHRRLHAVLGRSPYWRTLSREQSSRAIIALLRRGQAPRWRRSASVVAAP
jgi:hypothetical protein